jgi:hypothetical protein
MRLKNRRLRFCLAPSSRSARWVTRAAPALEELLKNLPPGIPEGIAKQFVGGLINQLKIRMPSDNKD